MKALDALTRLIERFPLYAALGILVVMPVAGQVLWTGHRDFVAAGERVAAARAGQAGMERRLEQSKHYQKYAEELQSFVTTAEGHSLTEKQGWTSYGVEIKDQPVSEEALRQLLGRSGPGPRYYFKPKRMEITALSARHLLPAGILNQLAGRDAGGGVRAPGQEPPPVAGEKVLFSLSGRFLVFPGS